MKKLKRTLFSMLAVVMLLGIISSTAVAVHSLKEIPSRTRARHAGHNHQSYFGPVTNSTGSTITIGANMHLLTTGGTFIIQSGLSTLRLDNGKYDGIASRFVTATAEGQIFVPFGGRVS